MDIALFSPSSLFDDPDANNSTDDEEINSPPVNYLERKHEFPGMELVVREFSFHELNANLLWPGTFAFSEWLVQHRAYIQGRRAIELGSGTGALAIFLHKAFDLDITTSDYADPDIEENIAHNCHVNGVIPVLPHLKHSWGDAFPIFNPDWDLVIASDILLYVKQYPNLITTISFLLNSYKQEVEKAAPRPTFMEASDSNSSVVVPRPSLLMSWRRRIGKEDESLFFKGCEKAGLGVQHLGSRVYCITPNLISPGETTTTTTTTTTDDDDDDGGDYTTIEASRD